MNEIEYPGNKKIRNNYFKQNYQKYFVNYFLNINIYLNRGHGFCYQSQHSSSLYKL